MVIGATGTQQTSLQNDTIFDQTTSSTPSESFVQQLVSAIESELKSSGNDSDLAMNILGGSAQTAADPQYTVTVQALNSATASEESSAATPLGTTPATTPATTASTGGNSSAAVDESTMTPTDAYWAAQPTAVQALRYAPDAEKPEMAQQLASEGYSIDVPIMVWGWDPLATMIQRQQEGYTWVPSALQASVEDAPGVSMPGSAPYNPNDPPAGSIQVSTAFANGTNIASDPIAEEWLQGESSTANTAAVSG
jgi:hypothetical protein